MSYVHLNVKSCFNFMNSIVKLDEAIVKTSKMGMSHLAINDINTMHTFFDFQNKCKDDKHVLHGANPIKHVFGVNFLVKSKYINDEFFLINLIAKNEIGYKNLIELSTKAKTNHQQFAWVTYEDLKEFSEGLFCLTGGSSGEVFYLEVHEKRKEAIELLKELKGIYGDLLYLEVMNHNIKDEIQFLDNGFVDEAIKMGILPVATNDVYYLNKKDAQYRALAVEMNSEINKLKSTEIDWIHKYGARYVDYNDEFYLKTEKQMEDAFRRYLSKYPDLLTNTQKIADECHAEVPIEKRFPEFPIPDGYDEESYFRKLMLEGFERRFPTEESFGKGFTKKDYVDRMEYEFEVIKKMGFLGYILIVQDYVNYAKDLEVYKHPEKYFPKNHFPDYSKISPNILNKDFEILVGPGRGSGAGSLLCYLMGICNLNPLTEGLLFERFLNPSRVSMPDIDVDFTNSHRYMIVEYVQNKYGFDHVCQIVTYNLLGVKSIIKNVGKALGIPYAVTDELSKNVPETVRTKVYLDDGGVEEQDKKVVSLEQIKELEFFKNKIKSDENIKKLFSIAALFDGLPASTGRHACGVIIGASPIKEVCPLMEVEGVLVSQFEKKAMESINCLKMDFLGLITLDIEAETVRLIKEVHGIDLKLDDIPTDDRKTFELLQRGDSSQVFQLESSGMKNLLRKMKPTHMDHITAVAALYRPGPMQFIDDYVKGMKNPEKVTYPHPLYKNASKDTFSILVYQEQIMQVVQDMAGFTLGEADILRRGIGKKQVEYINQMEIEFTDRCVKRGIDEKIAKEVYAMIKKFAEYGFNKSHSACYARIAYETAYLKAHYPECFMAANLTINADDKKKLLPCLVECRNMKIKILPPSIESSSAIFTVEKYKQPIGKFKKVKLGIRYGLAGIDRIGMDFATEIEKNDAKTLYDFMNQYPTARKNQMENLIYAGVFDKYGSRREMCEILSPIKEFIKRNNSYLNIYGDSVLNKIVGEDYYNDYEYSLMDKMNKEKNVINISLSGHILDYVRPLKNEYLEFNKIPNLLSYKDREEVNILGLINNIKVINSKKTNKPMAFISIEDEFTGIEGIIFPKSYENVSHLLEENVPVIISGVLSVEEEGTEEKRTILVNSIEKVLDKEFRIYVSKDLFKRKDIISKLKECNGICSVLSVDKDLKLTRENLYVDLGQACDIFKEHDIKYVVNTIKESD